MESISVAHSAGSPYASSIHLHEDASQPLEHNSGNIFSVSGSAGDKFSAADKCPDKMTVTAAVYSSNCFISVSECVCQS